MKDSSYMSIIAYKLQSYKLCIFAILGICLIAACIDIVLIGNLRTSMFNPNEYIPLSLSSWKILPKALLIFWVPFLCAFIVYIIAISYQLRLTKLTDKRVLWIILTVAIVSRIILLFSPPTLSDDIYRYLWDANISSHNINPYIYAPESEEIEFLRDDYYFEVNNKDVPTIYPPLMQLAFRSAASLRYNPISMKILFTLFDLGIILILILLLRRKNLSEQQVIIYAWNPLVLIEISGSGHNDSLVVGLMLAALLVLEYRRNTWSIALLTLSILAKWFSFMLVPIFFQKIRVIKSYWIFPALVFVLYLPYLEAGSHLFSGLLVYGEKWRFNDSLFSILFYLTGSLTVSKLMIVTAFGGVALYCFTRITDPVRSAFILVGAYLILTPTVQPWYLVWIIPFLCFYPNPAWIMLSGLITVSYYVVIQFVLHEIWIEEIWVRYVQYIPFYCLLIASNMLKRKGFKTRQTDGLAHN